MIREAYSQEEKQQNTVNGNVQRMMPDDKKQSVDIFSMLSKAQEEYHKGTTASKQAEAQMPVQNHVNVNVAQQFSNMFIQKDQPKPPQNQHHHLPKSIDMANFFAAAQNPNVNGNNAGGVIQQVHTLDEIEKQQQRVYSPTVMHNAKCKLKFEFGCDY